MLNVLQHCRPHSDGGMPQILPLEVQENSSIHSMLLGHPCAQLPAATHELAQHPLLLELICAWQGQPSSSSELTSCGAIGRKRRETRDRQRRPRLPTLELEDYQHPRTVHSAAKALGHAETKWSWRETRCVLLLNPRVPRLSDAFLLGCMCLEISEPIWALLSIRRQQFQPPHVKNLTFGFRRTCSGKKNENPPFFSSHLPDHHL